MAFSIQTKPRSIFSRYSSLKQQLKLLKLQTDISEFKDLLELDSDPESVQMIQTEIDVLTKQLIDLQKAAAEDPNDKKNAVCEIQSGVGGDESALFVAVLYKMYEEFLTSAKHSVETIDFTPGNMGGFKNISFIVKGKTPYGLLKYESGAHRVQRVPATETKGRVHTSIAAVTVLPEVEVEQVDINRADVKVETYNSGGKGGQHGNRSMNAVKLIHLPTGISACSQVKSYAMNLKMAWKTLATRIADMALQKTETAASEEKKRLRGSGMRNERIRTYNYPQDRVTDHRIKQSYALQQVIAGKLQPILDDLKENDL